MKKIAAAAGKLGEKQAEKRHEQSKGQQQWRQKDMNLEKSIANKP